ncbi:MAG TPA: carbon starvation CstA family protein [Spirochaetota bacterium]|nr:carbon starvation CstA family protein [Spirochaetota bacterium]HPI90704.1 carbon starvation CstA family protein [Spirochaetota bacterium]HPR49971.1 carbon starvation CstA family protein [Spirochaetota bacterium]
MNILIMLFVSMVLLYLGYRYYARFVEKSFDIDGTHTTPAVEINDGVDYVPTKKFVLFGHHFASIAGGGPIIGPTVALIFGFLPVWLWIVIGTVFVGVVHDFSALAASIREKGRSVAEIAESTFGRTGFLLFIGFTIIMLLMVTSVFLTLTTTALSSKYPLEFFGSAIGGIQTIEENGIKYAVIGGIASTSVIIITACAPILGYLLYKRNIPISVASILAVGICLVSIRIGFDNPIKIDPFYWMIILSIYTIFAAGVPVWIVLQPRDFTNSFLLYGGILAMLASTVVLGFSGTTIDAPSLNLVDGRAHLGYLWPILFITVACGACSGFHSLVAGGTSAKQIAGERPDAKIIGAGGMTLEAVFAICVVIAVGAGLSYGEFKNIVFPAVQGVKSNPILAFALGIGGLMEKAFALPKVYGTVFGILMVEGFVVTTLDTAVRLNRYLFEELWRRIFKNVPRFMNTYVFNSFLCVGLMFILAYYNAFKQLWALFGSANQLLAGLTLITVSVWLTKKGKKSLFAMIPGLFMFITTVASLGVILFNDYLPRKNYMLAAGDIVLLALSLGVVILVIKNIRKKPVQAY